jgi:TrmH family RNA methyltransferase
MKLISSRDNPQYKMWKKIVQSAKGIHDFGYYVLSGPKLVKEAIQLPNVEIRGEILTEGMTPISSAPGYRLPESLFKQIDVLGTYYNLLLIKTPIFKKWNETDPIQGIEVICPLGDPRNLGALVRSCAAFGVKTIVLTEESCHPFLPSAIKAASLACLHVEFKQGPQLAQLRGPMVALDIKGTPLTKFHKPKPFRFLVGQEGLGLKRLSSDICIDRVTISTESVESLNATVAASIALHHFYQGNHDSI